jgi:hypothetical protein
MGINQFHPDYLLRFSRDLHQKLHPDTDKAHGCYHTSGLYVSGQIRRQIMIRIRGLLAERDKVYALGKGVRRTDGKS